MSVRLVCLCPKVCDCLTECHHPFATTIHADATTTTNTNNTTTANDTTTTNTNTNTDNNTK